MQGVNISWHQAFLFSLCYSSIKRISYVSSPNCITFCSKNFIFFDHCDLSLHFSFCSLLLLNKTFSFPILFNSRLNSIFYFLLHGSDTVTVWLVCVLKLHKNARKEVGFPWIATYLFFFSHLMGQDAYWMQQKVLCLKDIVHQLSRNWSDLLLYCCNLYQYWCTIDEEVTVCLHPNFSCLRAGGSKLSNFSFYCYVCWNCYLVNGKLNSKLKNWIEV